MKLMRFLFVIISSLPCILFAQQNTIDSLVQLLPHAAKDTDKVTLLTDIAFQYASLDQEKARQYADEAMETAIEIEDTDGQMQATYTKGVIEYYASNIALAIEHVTTARKYYKQQGIIEKELKALNLLTGLYRNSSQLEEALRYANESLVLAESLESEKDIATALHSIGMLHMQVGSNELAETYFKKAIEKFEAIEDVYAAATSYQGLSSIIKSRVEAMEYAKKALDLFQELDLTIGQAYAYGSMGSIAYEMGDSLKSLEYLEAALALYEVNNFQMGIASVKSNLGLLLTQLDQFETAYRHLITSKEIATAIGADDILITTYRGLINCYAHEANVVLVSQSLDSLMAIQDTVYNREKAELMIESDTKYQVKEKETQIAQQELTLSQQNRLKNIILLSALTIILGLVILFQYLQNRQKQQKQATELALQLQQQEADQLRALDQLKSNFFANISHEFRTPLTLILGPLDQMRKGTLEGNVQSYFDIMHRNGQRLQVLINQLLDLSKLENNKMNLYLASGDIVSFSKQLASSMESWAKRKHIDYQLTFPDHPIWVKFDKDKVEKILTNLISNALKFTPSNGQVKVRLFSSTNMQSEHITFTISDTGIGIPSTEIDHIFERFYHSTETPDGTISSGIGLALVKELVTLQNGEINVSSEKNEGTTFTITLPFEQTEEPPKVTFIEERSDHSSNNLNTEKESPVLSNKEYPIVLIVEDNSDVRQYIRDQLAENYQILEAENGRIGLEKALETIPDLIITDVMMPEMNGTDLAQKLKQDERVSHIPIIMLTAKVTQSDKIKGLETGVDDYLIKPFDAQELQVKVKNLITQRKHLRERFTKESLLSPKMIAVTSVDEQFLTRLMELIEENMDNEQLSIEEMGREVGMSRSQLHRKIKALTDKSPSVFLRTIRLRRARHLLQQQAGNATEVAFMVGFSNAAYFSKCFKDEFGITPTESRKQT